jgi:hypothetical protein
MPSRDSVITRQWASEVESPQRELELTGASHCAPSSIVVTRRTEKKDLSRGRLQPPVRFEIFFDIACGIDRIVCVIVSVSPIATG